VTSNLRKSAQRSHCDWFAIAALLVMGLLAMSARTQENACALRTVFVNVEGNNGQPVDGLNSASFHAIRAGLALPVVLAEPNPLRRILIVLDESNSMHHPSEARSSSLVIANLVQQAAAGVQFAFATFSDNFEMQEDFTADHVDMVQRIVQDLHSRIQTGSSAIYDSALAAVGRFKPLQIGDAVLIVTDGEDNASHINAEDTKSRVAASGIPFYALVVESGDNQGMISADVQRGINRFAEIVESTGGEVFYVGKEYPSKGPHARHIRFRVEKDYQNLPEVARGVLQNMATGYRLQISLPASFPKPEDWKLEITSGSSGKDRALFVRYQPRLYPCPTPASH
jgi:hypothetical protein